MKEDSIYYEAANILARKLASLMMESKNFLVTQHFPGRKNVISDLLSFDGSERFDSGSVTVNPLAYDSPSNEELTNRFHSYFPQLIPKHI